MSERVCAVCAADGATVCSCDKPMTSTAIPSPKGETHWKWTVEERPHGTFLLSNGGYPIVMLSSAGPGHIVDTAAAIAAAMNAADAARRSTSSSEDVRREALEEAAKVVEPTNGPPCDCIALQDYEWWMPRCDCRNGGDADEAQSWCTSKNEARRIRALSQKE